MIKIISKLKSIPGLVFAFAMPFMASADSVLWRALVVCGNPVGEYAHPCKWNDVILFIKNFIYDLTILALPVAAVAFAWAGFKILTSGGDSGKLKEGKSTLIKVAIGFAWIIGAYIIVTFIMDTFVTLDSDFNLLK